jgi:hypothetical protein
MKLKRMALFSIGVLSVGLATTLTIPSAHSTIKNAPATAQVYEVFENCWFQGKPCGILAYVGSACNSAGCESQNLLGMDQLDMELYTTGIDLGQAAVDQPYKASTGNLYAVFTRMGADFSGETHHVMRVPAAPGIRCSETLDDGSVNPAFDDPDQCVAYDHAHFPSYIHGNVDYQFDADGGLVPFPGDGETTAINTNAVYDIFGLVTNAENPPAHFPRAISNWTMDGKTCRVADDTTCFPGLTELAEEGKLIGPFPLQYPRSTDGVFTDMVLRLPGVVDMIDKDLTPPQ